MYYLIYLCTNDLHGPVRKVFDAFIYITKYEGTFDGLSLGPGNREFLGPVNGIEPIGECHLRGKKKSRAPRKVSILWPGTMHLKSLKWSHLGISMVDFIMSRHIYSTGTFI